MKRLLISLALVTLSLIAVRPALAQSDDGCTHNVATVASLWDCVHHAAHEGHIDNRGVTQSLLAKLEAAQAAVERGQSTVAINALQAFIREVQAQAGNHIVTEHAGHLVEHAQLVIQALSE
jgi:hypothetical protein